MSRLSRSLRRSAPKSEEAGWPLVVYVWTFGAGLGGYVLGRIVADAFPHPVHWLSGVAGAAIGCGIGWLWYRWRGDII